MVVAHAVRPLHHSWDVHTEQVGYSSCSLSDEFFWADLWAFCGCGPGYWSCGSVYKGRLNISFSVTHSQSRYVVHTGSLSQKIVKQMSDNHFRARKSYCIFALRYTESTVSRLYRAWSKIPDSYTVFLLSLWFDSYPSVQYFTNQQ